MAQDCRLHNRRKETVTMTPKKNQRATQDTVRLSRRRMLRGQEVLLRGVVSLRRDHALIP